MNLKQSIIIALVLGVLSITAWESYWRYQGHEPSINDNKNLWANQRAKLENFNNKTVAIIGSSRILYDLQLDIWKEQTQTEPAMLATQGASPLPVFKDIVENTKFNGMLIIGVTPPLLFATTYPQAPFIERSQTLVDYYYKRTYAQRLNHKLSIPLQKNLAFITDADEDWDSDVDLKTLLKQIRLTERSAPPLPPFNNFEEITLERHMKMPERMVTDTAYANTVKKVWTAMLSGDFPPPEREATINAFTKLIEEFQGRGGQVILVRCPSDGLFKKIESMGFPREKFWDELVKKSSTIAYNYQDYKQFENLFLPEWSHLATKDAQFFTKELIKIMKNDGVLPNPKTN